MGNTIEENFDEGFLGTKRKHREYVEPTGIWIPSFWDTPEDIAWKEERQRQQFINDFRNEFQEAEEEREKQKKRNERLEELTQKLRSHGYKI
ncbi:MAG: hypothetical protein ABR985_14410 [Methanotrichaceae archaeon]